MSDTPYFYEQALRARFIQDVKEALGSRRITQAQQQGLQRLLDEPPPAEADDTLLRVDKLVMDDGTPTCAELTSAWMISDPAAPNGPVYLHTLLFGLERFNDRQRLIDNLTYRFATVPGMPRTLDRERVEGSLLEQRMLTVLDQQVEHLKTLTEQLQQLPSLYTVLEQTLREQIQARTGNVTLNVRTHLLQIVPLAPGTADARQVAMSMTLFEAALRDHANEPVPHGFSRQWLDERGVVLTTAQAVPYQQALTDVKAALPAVYERLLADYWISATADGRTNRLLAAQVLAESFRDALLICREERSLSLSEFRQLRYLLPSPNPETVAPPIQVSRLSVLLTDQPAIRLAGIFLIAFPFGQLPGLYLYSSHSGLSRFTNRQTLSAHFTTDAGRLLLTAHSAVEDRAQLGSTPLTLHLEMIEQSLFLEHIDSLIAVQKRNLRHVLGFSPLSHNHMAARIDDALDIRGLIDWRLRSLTDSGRWLAGSQNFESTWPITPAAQPGNSTARPATAAGNDNSWVNHVKHLDRGLGELGQARPDIVDCAADVLDRYLAVLGGPSLKARTLWVQTGGDPFIGLTELFLRRACGYSTEKIAPHSLVYSGSVDPQWSALVRRLPAPLLNQVLDRALMGFAHVYERQVRQFYQRPLRLSNEQIRPQVSAYLLRGEMLRLELSIEHRVKHLGEAALKMIWQVMDRPVASLRRLWGNAAVSVSAVQLRYAPDKTAVTMTNVFILYRPQQPGTCVFWSVYRGFRVYESLIRLEDYLKAELTSHERRQRWLDLLNEADRANLEKHIAGFGTSALQLRLQTLERHFIQALQDAEVERQCQAISATYRRAAKWGVDTGLFRRLLRGSEMLDRNRDALDSLAIGLEAVLLNALQPSWLRNAPQPDMADFVLAARQLYVTFDPARDFLFDIPDLRAYARQRLVARLKADFPALEIDPDTVTVTLTIYVPAPVPTGNIPSSLPAATSTVSERLADFSINRLSTVQQGTLSISLDTANDAISQALTPLYISSLVRSLDVADGYRHLLDEKLNEQRSDFAMRQAFYIEQYPPVERVAALQSRIKGELSEQAYEFIEAVLYMPDGIARLEVNGKKIVFSPLQLLAEPDATPDRVTGMYIIAPEVPQTGPWILYTVLSEDFLFKEYADQQSLLTDLRTAPDLQKLILQRVSARARPIYDHGGFNEPHLPFSTESSLDVPLSTPAPVTIQIVPYPNNVLSYLFRGTVETLKLLARQWSVTTSENDRQSTVYVLGLLVSQGIAFLPGRIGMLVGVWQSESLFQASLSAASQEKWGEATAAFSSALGTLVGARPTLEEEVIESLEAEEVVELEGPSTLPQFGWSKGTLTPQQIGLLHRFAVNDVALSALNRDELLNVYRDSSGQKQYAAVAGKVYQVRLSNEVWRIVGDTADGPAIRLDAEQQWQLDLPWGLKGGGGIVTRIQTTGIEMHLHSVAVVEARGMSAIRLRFRDRARRIAEAHSHARQYLEVCLDNLEHINSSGNVDLRTKHIVSNFFGVLEPTARLYESVKVAARGILAALMEPSLSPFSSERFVVISNRMGQENSNAFVFTNDPHRRIFLSEKFFRTPHYNLKLGNIQDSAFNHGAHYRATTLIHELSHQSGATEDIAYVESNAPFFDLLDSSSAYRQGLKDQLQMTQERTLSHLTAEAQLFRQLREGIWHDLKHSESAGKRAVLRISEKTTLEEARTVFYASDDKRSDIMMKNADSVSLLISLLGRRRFGA